MRRVAVILLTILIVVCVIALAWWCLWWSPAISTNDMGINIKKTLFTDNENSHSISIHYPQILGLPDKEREAKINSLIEDDVKKTLQNNGVHNLWLDFENIFISKYAMSILYKGNVVSANGQKIHPIIDATNIDLEKSEIIELNNVITNADRLYDMLLEGSFVAITEWEGAKAGRSSADSFAGKTRDEFEQALDSKAFNSMEWYIDGENFVIVVFDGNYCEYSINIEDVNEIISPCFLSKLAR